MVDTTLVCRPSRSQLLLRVICHQLQHPAYLHQLLISQSASANDRLMDNNAATRKSKKKEVNQLEKNSSKKKALKQTNKKKDENGNKKRISDRI